MNADSRRRPRRCCGSTMCSRLTSAAFVSGAHEATRHRHAIGCGVLVGAGPTLLSFESHVSWMQFPLMTCVPRPGLFLPTSPAAVLRVGTFKGPILVLNFGPKTGTGRPRILLPPDPTVIHLSTTHLSFPMQPGRAVGTRAVVVDGWVRFGGTISGTVFWSQNWARG